jgi:tryptophanyl-tRNA synthetase
VGLDGKHKMSKSLGNAIFLYDSEKDVQKKIGRIVTGRAGTTAPLSADNPLMQYIEVFLPADRAEQLKNDYAGGREVMDGHVKAEVAGAINALLEPMRARRAKLEGPAGEEKVLSVIREGIKKANAVAEQTLAMAKEKMGLGWGGRRIV